MPLIFNKVLEHPLCYSSLILQDRNSKNLTDFLDKLDSQGITAGKEYLRVFPGSKSLVWLNSGLESQGNQGKINDVYEYGYLARTQNRTQAQKNFATYNARRENLKTSPLWKRALAETRGVIAVAKFYEWVSPRCLIENGFLTVGQIQDFFERLRTTKELQAKKAGKQYKESPTDKKPILDRAFPVEFSAPGEKVLYFPVLVRDTNDASLGGFAVMTQPASEYILRVGHDRCPVSLDKNECLTWLGLSESSHLYDLIAGVKPPELQFSVTS